MDTGNSELSGQFAVVLNSDDERTQFVAIGTDTSTNTQLKPTYRINDSKAPSPVFGTWGSYTWSTIQKFFNDWTTMSDQLLVLTQQEVDQYIPTGNVDDLTIDATIIKTIPKGNTNWKYDDAALPIDVQITFKGSDLITDPAEPLELATDDKTVIGAVNENKDNTDAINTSFKSLERDLLYNAVGNYIAQNPAENSYYPTRLNTISVLSADKIPSPDYTTTGAVTGFSIKVDSDVNLLEAIWTNWKNTVELNTDVYGISALNVPELTATNFIPDLSGKSIIENMNDMYLTLSACCNDEVDLTDLPSLTGIYDSLSQLSAADVELFDQTQTNGGTIIDLQTQIADLSGQLDLITIGDSLNSDAVQLLHRVTELSEDFAEITALSATVDEIEVKLSDYDIDIDNLQTCCTDNTQLITAITDRLDNLDPATLNEIKNIFDGMDFSTYVTRLSEVEQSINDIGDITNHINSIETNNTLISSLCADMVVNQSDIQDLFASVPTIDTTELANLVQSINNLTDIQTVLDDLSATQRFEDLEMCCNNNTSTLIAAGDNINTNTTDIQNITTNVASLCDKLDNPTGVVKTTTNQTVSGEKTLKSTLTVGASSYFEDTVTIGDVDQPKIFDVCSTNGVTTVNITNLPVNKNGLNPGDLYVTEIDGVKVLAIV